MIGIKEKSAVTDSEYAVCKSLCDALEPLKEVTKAICRNDANLVTADAAVEVLLEELKKNGNIFALQLREKVRIIERR